MTDIQMVHLVSVNVVPSFMYDRAHIPYYTYPTYTTAYYVVHLHDGASNTFWVPYRFSLLSVPNFRSRHTIVGVFSEYRPARPQGQLCP